MRFRSTVKVLLITFKCEKPRVNSSQCDQITYQTFNKVTKIVRHEQSQFCDFKNFLYTDVGLTQFTRQNAKQAKSYFKIRSSIKFWDLKEFNCQIKL